MKLENILEEHKQYNIDYKISLYDVNEENIEFFKYTNLDSFRSFIDIYQKYTPSQFIDLLKEKIDENKYELYTNLLDFNDNDLELKTTNVFLNSALFVLVFELENSYFVLSNQDQLYKRDIQFSPLYKAIYLEIVEYLFEFIKEGEATDDVNEINDILNVSNIQTYISGVHKLDRHLLTNVELNNHETVFMTDDDKVIDLNNNEISFENYALNYNELFDDGIERASFTLSQESHTPTQQEENQNQEDQNQEDQLTQLRNELNDNQWHQATRIVQLLGQQENYDNIYHQARDLGYVE